MRTLGSVVAALTFAPLALADENSAAKYITKRGGHVERDENALGNPVVRLIWRKVALKDNDLAQVAELTKIEEFLPGCKVSR